MVGFHRLDVEAVRVALKDFESRLEREKENMERRMKESLNKKGVTGSAVIPNIKADRGWIKYVSDLNDEFQARLLK